MQGKLLCHVKSKKQFQGSFKETAKPLSHLNFSYHAHVNNVQNMHIKMVIE